MGAVPGPAAEAAGGMCGPHERRPLLYRGRYARQPMLIPFLATFYPYFDAIPPILTHCRLCATSCANRCRSYCGVVVVYFAYYMPSISICHNPTAQIPPICHFLSPSSPLQVSRLAGHALEAGVLAPWTGELLRQLARTSPPPERGSAQVFSARGSRCAPAHTRPTRPVVTYYLSAESCSQ
jgi:hypothetical protein